ncbi:MULTISPECIES: hypothetical protein [unclassified Microcella]|uniref:hypothetical protein n=1 Tax=unclassified Microcella TaxID=2630066 RepID=UPI0006FB0C01|nr:MULTISPECIES: hypothetical protein [unclassified Microcella]KQV24840.1 hypothetical protein ASC54_10095 [Yonghaparkia sp. Root332]KRF31124.1 hypothetical protein ASG83_09905 [Yonghaparkia sp. Soil809]
MDAQTDRHGSDDPVAHDIESRNPDSGDIVAGEQVLDEGHVAPDQDERGPNEGSASAAAGGPIEGSPEGEPESLEERRDGADERTDAAAPPKQEQPG